MPSRAPRIAFKERRKAMGLFRPSQPGRAGGIAVAANAPRRKLLRHWPWEIRLIVLATIYLVPPLALAVAAAMVYFTLSMPDPMGLRLKERAPVVRVLARDGSLLSERGGDGAYVPIDLLPRHLIDAVIATEDRRFFKHWGLDPAGMVRAGLTNLRAGRVEQGGSTLTQQLAKNLFLGSERTLARKLEELILALWLEARLGKRNILELYLNRVYLGAGAYGVETASQRFFGKSAREVTRVEAAVLAGLLKAPSRYSPALNPQVARERARNVLAKMVEARLLPAEEGDKAARAPLRFVEALQRGASGLDYAVDAVLEQLPPLAVSPASDVIVETSIDGNLQRRAQALVTAVLSSEGPSARASQAGLVLIDLEGGIRAVVGGRSYAESQFNRALKAKRQPGSAFKMFVYLAALESGLEPDSTVLDLPILGSGWSPRNEGAGYRGAVTLREALAQSMNAAAARLNMTVGPHRTAAVARRLGIRSRLRAEASLALGTSEVSLVELAGAYGVLANGGRALEPHLIKRVRTGSGRVLFERREEPARVLVAPALVAAMNDMLGAALASGTGKRAALVGHPAAGKTGTSQDFRDAWFVGYTAQFVAGVWVGNDDGRAMNRVVGGSLPAKLWHDVMTVAHDSRAPAALSRMAPTSAAMLATGAIEPADQRASPLMPRQRIEPEFVDRVAGEDGDAADRPQSTSRRWLRAAKDLLRELMP
jgi:penicillin-binding protein 1A